MNCTTCNKNIDIERYNFLIETGRTVLCKHCSVEKRAIGYMDWGHKTAPSLVMVPANNKENIRRCNRVNRRAR